MAIKKSRQRAKIAHDLPVIGTKLHGRIRKRTVSAEVVENPSAASGVGILYDGKLYTSLSSAASAVTGYMVNGWRFWKTSK